MMFSGKALKIQDDLFQAQVLIAECRHNYYCILHDVEITRTEYKNDDFAKIINDIYELREKMKKVLEKQLINDIKKEMIKNDLNEEIEKTKAFINKCDKEIYGEAK